MKIRNYNIYFNTHTISGIIVSALLYVIFFAGTLSFFKKEFSAWQANESTYQKEIDHRNFQVPLDSLSATKDLTGRNIIYYLSQGGVHGYINVSASQDTLRNKKNKAALKPVGQEKRKGRGRGGDSDASYFGYNFIQNKASDYASSYDLGEFFYRLHFLAPLNEVPIRLPFAPFGYFIAGLTSFIFLFALITGLLLHWDKLVSNFYIFRPYSKWKTIWTDMHTALGVIGFPYQLVYAITGIVLILNSVLMVPFDKMLYKDAEVSLYEDLGEIHNFPLSYSYSKLDTAFNLGHYIQLTRDKWPGSKLKRIYINNYGDKEMYITIETEPPFKQSFAGSGLLSMRIIDGTILKEKSPTDDVNYIDRIKSVFYRLHFGDFAGYPLKIVYFILGIMGCFVIISGILIWLVARDKNNVIRRKRVFNFWLANVFLAICLTMLPVSAITFVWIKFSAEVNQSLIYKVYFNLWWILALYYIIRRNINRTSRETLFLGAISSFLVPIANGIQSNNWMWHTFIQRKLDIFYVDFLWLLIGLISLIAFVKMKNFVKSDKSSAG
ncbi:PepSY-associated TM helix domain-containing protein [Sphingobacterium sp. HJSM2_6]|uniref:PepSY-associated TM helix domain-containing protein n=1 Tax=Sphingobacterium sp. HJSM2_6 TaxID=3366264 RepID=UPI003BEC3852